MNLLFFYFILVLTFITPRLHASVQPKIEGKIKLHDQFLTRLIAIQTQHKTLHLEIRNLQQNKAELLERIELVDTAIEITNHEQTLTEDLLRVYKPAAQELREKLTSMSQDIPQKPSGLQGKIKLHDHLLTRLIALRTQHKTLHLEIRNLQQNKAELLERIELVDAAIETTNHEQKLTKSLLRAYKPATRQLREKLTSMSQDLPQTIYNDNQTSYIIKDHTPILSCLPHTPPKVQRKKKTAPLNEISNRCIVFPEIATGAA